MQFVVQVRKFMQEQILWHQIANFVNVFSMDPNLETGTIQIQFARFGSTSIICSDHIDVIEGHIYEMS